MNTSRVVLRGAPNLTDDQLPRAAQFGSCSGASWVLSLCLVLPKVLSMTGDFAGYLPTLLAEAQLRAGHTYLPPWLSYELVLFWFAGTTSCTSSPGWPRESDACMLPARRLGPTMLETC